MGVTVWILLVALMALGSSLTALFLWQQWFARLEADHTALAETRQALDEERTWFEEGRRFVRKRPQQAFLCLEEVEVEQRRSFRTEEGAQYLVLHERIRFRNFALSNWLEQEVVLEPGDDVDQLATAVSIFASGVLGARMETPKPYVDEMQPPAYTFDVVSAPEGVAEA